MLVGYKSSSDLAVAVSKHLRKTFDKSLVDISASVLATRSCGGRRVPSTVADVFHYTRRRDTRRRIRCPLPMTPTIASPLQSQALYIPLTTRTGCTHSFAIFISSTSSYLCFSFRFYLVRDGSASLYLLHLTGTSASLHPLSSPIRILQSYFIYCGRSITCLPRVYYAVPLGAVVFYLPALSHMFVAIAIFASPLVVCMHIAHLNPPYVLPRWTSLPALLASHITHGPGQLFRFPSHVPYCSHYSVFPRVFVAILRPHLTRQY